MADGHCAAELDVREDESMLMIGKGGSSDSECVAEDRSGSLKKSFYVSGDLCSDIVSNGGEELDVESSGLLNEICRVMGSEHVEFSGDFKGICSEGEDNCRKKRCADRYDSSESSDRYVQEYLVALFQQVRPILALNELWGLLYLCYCNGVAVLSCTDCSGSSSSSGTSDITDPGSPFSSASSHSSNSDPDPDHSVLGGGGGGKMPPTQSSETADWPWLTGLTGLEGSSALKRFQLLDRCASAAKRKLTLHADEEYDSGNGDNASQSDSLAATKTLLVFLSGSGSASNKQLPSPAETRTVPFLATCSDPPLTVFRQPEPEPPDDDDEDVEDDDHDDDDDDDEEEDLLDEDLLPSAAEPPPAAIPAASAAASSLPPSPAPLTIVVDEPHSSCALPLPMPPSVCPTSPILSAPRTIRFPARNGAAWKGHYHLTDIACHWNGCHESFTTSLALIEHLQVQHVNTQSLSETFVCLWVGCKVFEKTSCSRSWLERHVLSHGGNKPYRCIVGGCGQRFSSQIMLERHVNGHFNQTDSNGSGGSGSRKSLETAPNKLFRRNGKKLRYRRQPFSARMFDYFDAGTMEKLQQRLINVTESRIAGDMDQVGSNYLTLHSKVMGRRIEPDGKTSYMLRWYPSNVLSDEWVNEQSVTATRQMALSQLPAHCEYTSNLLLSRHRPDRRRRKQQTPTLHQR